MQIAADDLAGVLKTLVHLVPKRSTLPALEHVLFDPDDNGIAITATDLTTQAKVVIPATATFAVCLPARPLLEFVTSIDRDAEISLSLRGAFVRVTGAGAMLELPRLPGLEFPAGIKHGGAAIDVEDPSAFLDALDWVSRAIGHDVTRPQLTGLFFDGDHLVATDGHRLHKATIDGLTCPRALAPATAVALVLRALQAGGIEISVGEKTVCFTSARWTITTRMIDATFPPYQQVIPKAELACFTMKVATGVLEAGINRACGRGGRYGDKLMKLRANGALVLGSSIHDVQRTATVGVVDSTHEGPEDHFQGFNARYLIDAVTDVDAIASLRFFKTDEPLVIEIGERARTAVVMPCRL